MLTYLRYALAAVCFAASVGCLALSTRSDIVRHANGDIALLSVKIGSARVQVWRGNLCAALGTPVGLALIDHPVAMERWGRTASRLDRFMLTQDAIVCPLWYPALIFALAGVGVLRFRRQFSIRQR